MENDYPPVPAHLVTKKDRIMAHFHEQEGKCWICGFPMMPYSTTTPMSRVAATLDHLAERNSTNGRTRPTKAAHRMCNSARGHASGIDGKILNRITRLFQNQAWVKMVFGKDSAT